ncbi:hypothetical protein BU17DRAFT_61779 [Hysterangium stoloniferum]|nr:hypothetical protein BU17DRAFT_61779 [Hysterangium stoloniferum]
MSTSNEIAPSGQDILSLLQEVDWLQPLVSPAVLRMERQEIDDTGTREISRIKLRERSLSEEDVEVSVEEWVRKRNVLFMETVHRANVVSAKEREIAMTHRIIFKFEGAPPTPQPNPVHIVGIPGYYCGVGMERVGRNVLHNAKIAALMAKLMIYKRMACGEDRAFNNLMRKHLTLRRIGKVIQETIDLMRPTYPRQIRQQASVILVWFWHPSVIQGRIEGQLMTELGFAFLWCPGTRWGDRDQPSAMTSSLYNAVIKSPLHTNLNEVASAFVLQIAGYLSCPCHSRTFLLAGLGFIVEQTCHMRQLSVEELTAIRGCIEFWTKLLTSTFLVWISYAASASLTLIMDMYTMYSLLYGILDLKTFFGNRTLHTHHIKQLNVVYSLIEPLLRLILTHPSPNVYLLWSGDKLIEVTLTLIAGSSDIESACSTVRNLDIIAILPRLIPHCDTMRGSLNDKYLVFRLETLTLAAQSFLCVIATPFTGVIPVEGVKESNVLVSWDSINNLHQLTPPKPVWNAKGSERQRLVKWSVIDDTRCADAEGHILPDNSDNMSHSGPRLRYWEHESRQCCEEVRLSGCSKVFQLEQTPDCREFSTSGVLGVLFIALPQEISDNQSTPLVIKEIQATVTEYRSNAEPFGTHQSVLPGDFVCYGFREHGDNM